jgi:hypothetical protein
MQIDASHLAKSPGQRRIVLNNLNQAHRLSEKQIQPGREKGGPVQGMQEECISTRLTIHGLKGIRSYID